MVSGMQHLHPRHVTLPGGGGALLLLPVVVPPHHSRRRSVATTTPAIIVTVVDPVKQFGVIPPQSVDVEEFVVQRGHRQMMMLGRVLTTVTIGGGAKEGGQHGDGLVLMWTAGTGRCFLRLCPPALANDLDFRNAQRLAYAIWMHIPKGPLIRVAATIDANVDQSSSWYFYVDSVGI